MATLQGRVAPGTAALGVRAARDLGCQGRGDLDRIVQGALVGLQEQHLRADVRTGMSDKSDVNEQQHLGVACE